MAGPRLGRGAGRRRARTRRTSSRERLDRLPRRRRRARRRGHAYYCYCTPDELKARREAAEAAGRPWIVRPHVPRAVTGRASPRAKPADAARRAVSRARRADVVRGPRARPIDVRRTRTSRTSSSSAPTAIPPTISRSSWTTWTWRSRTSSAATITSRTRRSRCCCTRRWRAPVPPFAHVPLILGPDKKRLSKRHGATSVGEYEQQGYLPEAMVELPRAARLVAGRRPGGVHARGAGRALRARRHQRRQRRLQPREAGLVQPAAHHAACRAGEILARLAEAFEAAGLRIADIGPSERRPPRAGASIW